MNDEKEKVLKFFSSKDFAKINEQVQAEVKTLFERVKEKPKELNNFFEFVKSGNFLNLNDSINQLLLLKVLSNRFEDKGFREDLVSLAGQKDFKALSVDLRTKVLDDVDKFANQTSYTNRQLNEKDRNFLLEKIIKTSIFSAKNLSNIVIRNTLNHIIKGTLPLELIDNKSTICGDVSDGNTFGCNLEGSKILYLVKSANSAVFEDFIETLCHEANHALNHNVAMSNVLDRFYNEYRAHIVGKEGRGKTLTAALTKEFLDKLGHDKTKTPDGYMAFNDLYKNTKFPEFKKIIDQAYKDAEKGTAIDALELKRRLITVTIFKTAYILGTTNIDNQ